MVVDLNLVLVIFEDCYVEGLCGYGGFVVELVVIFGVNIDVSVIFCFDFWLSLLVNWNVFYFC